MVVVPTDVDRSSVPDTPKDEALMEAYLGGDSAAFSQLFRRISPRIFGFLQRSFDHSTADDLLQQTFLKAHRARATYEVGRPVKAWLFAIAARVRIDEWRRRKHHLDALVADGTGSDDDRPFEGHADLSVVPADLQLVAAERAAEVNRALLALPESQREVVHLHFFEGLGFSDIGGILGMSEGAAKLKAFRAYEKLRLLILPDAVAEPATDAAPKAPL